MKGLEKRTPKELIIKTLAVFPGTIIVNAVRGLCHTRFRKQSDLSN